MKKLLGLFKDAFLFVFLLIILATPVVISFNLDPRLYISKKGRVAGVANDVSDYTSDLEINEQFSSSERVLVLDSKQEKNKYEAKFRITAGSRLSEVFRIGELKSEGAGEYKVNLYSNNEALRGVKIWLLNNNISYILFDGDQFEEVVLPQSSTGLVELKFSSDFNLGYSVDVKMEIRSV